MFVFVFCPALASQPCPPQGRRGIGNLPICRLIFYKGGGPERRQFLRGCGVAYRVFSLLLACFFQGVWLRYVSYSINNSFFFGKLSVVLLLPISQYKDYCLYWSSFIYSRLNAFFTAYVIIFDNTIVMIGTWINFRLSSCCLLRIWFTSIWLCILNLLVTRPNRNEVMKVHVVFRWNVTGSFADDIILLCSSWRYHLYG